MVPKNLDCSVPMLDDTTLDSEHNRPDPARTADRCQENPDQWHNGKKLRKLAEFLFLLLSVIPRSSFPTSLHWHWPRSQCALQWHARQSVRQCSGMWCRTQIVPSPMNPSRHTHLMRGNNETFIKTIIGTFCRFFASHPTHRLSTQFANSEHSARPRATQSQRSGTQWVYPSPTKPARHWHIFCGLGARERKWKK